MKAYKKSCDDFKNIEDENFKKMGNFLKLYANNLATQKIQALLLTDILFQTTYWGQVKSHPGWKLMAFDVQSAELSG